MALLIKNIRLKRLLTRIHGYLSQLIGLDHCDQSRPELDQALLENQIFLQKTIKKNTNRLASALVNNEKDLNYAFEVNLLSLKSMLAKTQEKLKENINDKNINLNEIVDSLCSNISDKLISNSNELKTSILNSIRELSDKPSKDLSSILEALSISSQSLQSTIASKSDHLKNDFFGLEEKLTKILTQQNSALAQYLSDRSDQSNQAITQNLTALDEKINQASRRERRSQQALEYLSSRQDQILDLFQKMEPQSDAQLAKGPLIDFADNFVLWLLSLEKSQKVKILAKKFNNLLDEFGLALIADLDVPFDPALHMACDTQSDLSKPEDLVLQIISPGYFDNQKLIRSALVVVNRWASPYDQDQAQAESWPTDPLESEANLPVEAPSSWPIGPGPRAGLGRLSYAGQKAKKIQLVTLALKRKKISKNLAKAASKIYNRPRFHLSKLSGPVKRKASLVGPKLGSSLLRKARGPVAGSFFRAKKKKFRP